VNYIEKTAHEKESEKPGYYNMYTSQVTIIRLSQFMVSIQAHLYFAKLYAPIFTLLDYIDKILLYQEA
jgi:hypothetical protein